MKTFLIFFSALFLFSCSDSTQLLENDQDVEALTLIIAETLSDQNDGFITEMYDFKTEFIGGSHSGHAKGIASSGPRPGHGRPQNVVKTYDPETGKHVIEFDRSFSNPMISKSQQVYMSYIFTSADGGFVEFPALKPYSSVEFNGQRSGSITTIRKNSASERVAEWTMSGFDADSDVITLEGSQSKQGSMVVKTKNGDLTKEYSMTMSFDGIELDKSFREDSTLENKLSGTIQFEMNMVHTLPNGEIKEKSNSGSIDLAGDGKALLRIMGVRQIFTIRLKDGEVN